MEEMWLNIALIAFGGDMLSFTYQYDTMGTEHEDGGHEGGRPDTRAVSSALVFSALMSYTRHNNK